MKKNQKELTIIYLLGSLTLAVIVACTLLTISRLKSTTSSDASTSNQGLYITDTASLPFAYEVPASWKQVASKAYSFTELRSPDFKSESKTGQELIVQGAKINLSCGESSYSGIEDLKKQDPIYQLATSSQDITINNGQTVAVLSIPNYDGPVHRITTFFVGARECSVAIEESLYQNPVYKDIYDRIIDSISL